MINSYITIDSYHLPLAIYPKAMQPQRFADCSIHKQARMCIAMSHASSYAHAVHPGQHPPTESLMYAFPSSYMQLKRRLLMDRPPSIGSNLFLLFITCIDLGHTSVMIAPYKVLHFIKYFHAVIVVTLLLLFYIFIAHLACVNHAWYLYF